jgi:hypothetical protein
MIEGPDEAPPEDPTMAIEPTAAGGPGTDFLDAKMTIGGEAVDAAAYTETNNVFIDLR